MMTTAATITAALLTVAGAALAQSADSKYCATLSEKFDSYLETQGDKGGNPTPPDVVKAMDECKSDPASAIPVLEKSLKAARLNLPPRG